MIRNYFTILPDGLYSLGVTSGCTLSKETALPDLISKDREEHGAAILLATCSSHRLSVWTHRILSVCVKSYRSESHMQSVSVSGMNYTARDGVAVHMLGFNVPHPPCIIKIQELAFSLLSGQLIMAPMISPQ